MAFLLIEGLIDVVELISSAIAVDSAAVAGSGIAGVAGEAASLALAGGATVATIGHQMAQKTSRQTTIGSGEIPQSPNIIDDGTRNVVYDPGADPTTRRVVYQPMINSSGRGDTRHVDGTDNGGFYGGVWFGRQKKKRRRQFM